MNISFWKEKGSKYIMFILAGLLILVMCIPTGTSIGTLTQEEETVSNVELEERLAQVLSAMEGVGDVRVVVRTQTVAGAKRARHRPYGSHCYRR